VQREFSRNLLTSSSHIASQPEQRDNQSLIVSSIQEEVSSATCQDRSGWILNPPSFIRTCSNPALRSFDKNESSLVLQINPSQAVLELSSAKAVNHDSPHYGTHCAKEQHDEVAHGHAIPDISLVEVCNPDLSSIHGPVSVQVSVPVVTNSVS
jgi:hypothetical protein